MRKVTCSQCGVVLSSDNNGPCPDCGGGVITHISVSDCVNVYDGISGEKRREYYQHNLAALDVVILITVLAPIIGLLVADIWGIVIGYILSLVSYFVGP